MITNNKEAAEVVPEDKDTEAAKSAWMKKVFKEYNICAIYKNKKSIKKLVVKTKYRL